MQNFYPYKIMDAEEQKATKTTFSKVLPGEGQASALIIEARCKNGATSNVANLLIENIKELSLTGDGVDKIYSLDGYALWKYLWSVQGKCPIGSYSEHPVDDQWVRLQIPFGRYLGDLEYMLNLDKYNEVRLDVEYDFASKNVIGPTGFGTGLPTFKLDFMKTLPGASLTSKGCRRVVERKSWTTAVSGEETWDFVQDYPYTAIMPYARFISIYGDPFKNIKLDLGGGKPILIDRDFDVLSYEMAAEMKIDCDFIGKYMVADTNIICTHGGGNVDCIPVWSPDAVAAVDPWQVMRPYDWGGDQVKINVAHFTGAAAPTAQAAIQRITARCAHFGMGSLLYIPLSDYPSWDNAIRPEELKDAVLKVTQNEAAATGKVISEQILPQ